MGALLDLTWIRKHDIIIFVGEKREVAQLGRAPGLGLGGRRFESCLPDLYHRGVEQLVARRAHNPEVVGSNPSPAIILNMMVP